MSRNLTLGLLVGFLTVSGRSAANGICASYRASAATFSVMAEKSKCPERIACAKRLASFYKTCCANGCVGEPTCSTDPCPADLTGGAMAPGQRGPPVGPSPEQVQRRRGAIILEAIEAEVLRMADSDRVALKGMARRLVADNDVLVTFLLSLHKDPEGRLVQKQLLPFYKNLYLDPWGLQTGRSYDDIDAPPPAAPPKASPPDPRSVDAPPPIVNPL